MRILASILAPAVLRPAALALAVLALPVTAVAQDGSGTGGGDNNAGPARVPTYEQRKDGLYELKQKDDGLVYDRKLSKVEIEHLRATGVITIVRASALCKTDVFANPRRLTAGRHGTLKVLVSFTGSVVVPSDASTTLELKRVAGFTFGKPTLEPATASQNPGKFRGAKVHDDFLLFDVPVTVASSFAPDPAVYITGKVFMDFHDGTTGLAMGRFFADIVGRVTVGNPLPRVTPRTHGKPSAPTRQDLPSAATTQAPIAGGVSPRATSAAGEDSRSRSRARHNEGETPSTTARGDGTRTAAPKPFRGSRPSLWWVFCATIAVLLLLLLVVGGRRN